MSGPLRHYLKFFEEMGIDSIRLNLPQPQQPQTSSLTGKEGRGEGAPGAKAVSTGGNALSPPVSAPAAGGETGMREIRDDLGDCVRCKLHRHRRQIVFGVGAEHAELMFVGEAPGADEDAQGIPFVGKAGQLLTRIIESIGLRRDQVYIANIIKCRPPQNRNPEPDEIEKCSPFLLRQIALIQPRIICALGKFAAQTLLETTEPIGQLRGRVFDKFGARVVPTFHPSYLLRNPAGKREVWEDMKTIRRMLDERH